jgi:ferredoxin-fold anticodon binding domain-containing protein
VIKSVERTKELFKVPSGELHKSMLRNVIDNFSMLESVFHMQFIVYMIKEVNMVESPKLNKHEKELEQEILDYMEQFINNKDCI